MAMRRSREPKGEKEGERNRERKKGGERKRGRDTIEEVGWRGIAIDGRQGGAAEEGR